MPNGQRNHPSDRIIHYYEIGSPEDPFYQHAALMSGGDAVKTPLIGFILRNFASQMVANDTMDKTTDQYAAEVQTMLEITRQSIQEIQLSRPNQ